MKTAVVMFSGGVDSTYVTARCAPEFDRLILNTLIVPGMINPEFSTRSFLQLKKIFGGKLVHNIIDIREFVNSRRGGVLGCLRDNFKYRFFYSWCLGCKAAMHMHTIQYCRDHGIKQVLDGSNYYDQHALEQKEDVKRLLADIYKGHGIEFFSPGYFEESLHSAKPGPWRAFLRYCGLYRESTELRVKFLRKLGVDMGKGWISHYRGSQPSCLISPFFNLARLPMKFLFGEAGGCCILRHGYLNYIIDKIYGAGQAPAAVRAARSRRAPVYLDNNASTRTDPEVVKAMAEFQDTDFGNASSLHSPGMRAKEAVEAARAIIAGKINASPEEIIFTSGGTESNNLALKGLALAHRARGRHLVISAVEHPSVSAPAAWLKSQGFELTVLGVDGDGLVSPAEVSRAIRKDTVLVSVMHANNEIGTIEPVAEIGRICAEKEVYFHVDACQSFTKVPLDVAAQNIDALSLSSHKIYGPKGVGALYLRKGIPLTPLFHGGGQEEDLRSGTYNTPGIVGFGKAAELAAPEAALRMARLRDYAIEKLAGEEGVASLNGPKRERLCNNISLILGGMSSKSVISRLDELGIHISSGAACSSRVHVPSHVLLAIGRSNDEAFRAVRIGLSKWTTAEEIDFFAENLRAILKAGSSAQAPVPGPGETEAAPLPREADAAL